MGSGWFFVGEPYYGDLYPFCFRSGGRFFMAERSIRLTGEELLRQIQDHTAKANRRPALVKDTPEVRYMAWYRSDVTYVPYSFIVDGKKRFFRSLTTRTGSESDDRRNRDEMAALLRNLRGNHYEYCAFYSPKKDIFEFFDWLRQNKYTLEIQGALFSFAPNRSFVDFHGNVCEYSAAFHYRVYSRELFMHIINQLRTVRRCHAWCREEQGK